MGIATECIDRLLSTADAHGRVIVVEVMGRYAGWIALHAGVAGGADVILIPEIPFDLEPVARHDRAQRERRGAKFSIVVVAEGACPKGGERVVLGEAAVGQAERLGGIGDIVAARARAADRQGGAQPSCSATCCAAARPTAFDRLLGAALRRCCDSNARSGQGECDGRANPPGMKVIPISEAVGPMKSVPLRQ